VRRTAGGQHLAAGIRNRAFGTSALWPLAAASLFILTSAAAAVPEGARSPPAPRIELAQADGATKDKDKAAAKAKTKGKPAAEAKSEKAKAEKPKATQGKPEKKTAEPKAESKSDKKTAGKPAAQAAKPAAAKAAAAPSALRPKPGASIPSLAPPVAAALAPSLPKDNVAPVTVVIPEPAPIAATGKPVALPPPANTIITAAAIDVAAVKRAAEMVRNRRQADATDVRNGISDPAAKKLVEWIILRSDDATADFSRYTAFIAANPNWPSIVTLRRKAEAVAFQEKPDDARVRTFFNQFPPLSAKGRFAFARALIAAGNRKEAEELVRETYRNDSFSQEVESRILDAFGDMITRADHKARMDRRLYEKDDTEAGLRAAQRLGGNEPVIAKARIAMLGKGGNKATLDAVPAAARDDIGFKFARLQMLRRADELTEALALIKTIPKLDRTHDLDEWWMERRMLARKLLDAGNPKDAYLVARDTTPPESPNYRVESQFMAGWIALRFLHDPATAHAHFLKISEGNENPISLARGAYWTGRAAEVLGRNSEAKKHYQEAARYPTTYYGQLARAKAGLGELHLNPMPTLSTADRARATQSDVVRAAELLYAIDARDVAWAMMADLGDKSTDAAILVLMAELTAKYKDARGMLLLGKLALARGFSFDHAAFPNIGVPDYTPLASEVDPALVYSIVRQESWFNPKTISSANALGLMQVTPAAGKYVTSRYKATFDQKRLLSDQSYNVQIGAAELIDNIKDYRGSYIMAFAGYNAGRGRVKEWVAKYGDPRDPKIDPIDWVERIPFAETRNYVQRVMENFQVYRIRFGGGSRLLIEADLRRGGAAAD
jgi:soluble lytic murein transglycosylase